MSTGHPLTDEQILFIRKNFANMRNQDIADALGISRSCVCHTQAVYGLRKSKEHNTKMAKKAGHASSVARGGVALGITPEVIAKRVETYKRTLAVDRARRNWGLPQLTKARVLRQPRQKRSQRCYLKALGYIIDEVNLIAYYTPETRRATRMEQGRKGVKYYYKFKEYPTNGDNTFEELGQAR